MGANMAPKVDEKWSLGRFVLNLGGLLRSPIFEEIWVGKKTRTNQKMNAKVFQKAKFPEARRNVRGQWGTIGGSRT